MIESLLERTYKEYIKLLEAECSDLSGFMFARNPKWQSNRAQKGIELREKIKRLQEYK